jgi:predicted ATPase/DNA-binding CsgD family transcriptional regulator
MDERQVSEGKLYVPLTRRERDILALLAQDLTDREIAERLFVAHTTVRWYNRQIYNKLGVDNRVQAVERATLLGLLGKPNAAGDASPPPRHNLPAQLTPFVGRLRELNELTQLLSHPQTRLVTLLAPGGMGKTRLALAAAELLLGQFRDGVYFVPLAPLTTSDQISLAIAEACGFQFAPDSRTFKQQVLDFLRAKSLLLVLDNFEHLLEGAALVSEILQAAPQVTLLVTSRERLHLSSETLYSLVGLPYPEGSHEDEVSTYAAVKLFVACAQRAQPHFRLTDASSVVSICQRVQGMPLAIELAAAWVASLSPKEVADEIQRDADVLQTTLRDVPERLRSVRMVFEATWRRLSEAERRTYQRLSVFKGGFTREAAQAVAGATTAIAALVDKALLWRNPDSERYDVHELLRQYAERELEAAGEADTTREAHQRYFGEYAHHWGQALKTPQQLVALKKLSAEVDNLRAAFDRAIETGAPDIIEPFVDHWLWYEIHGRWAEGRQVFGKAIARLEGQDSPALAKLLAAQAMMILRFGPYDNAEALSWDSVAMLRRCGLFQECAFPLTNIGYIRRLLTGPDSAEPICREALEIAQQYEDRWSIEYALIALILNAKQAGRFDEAQSLYEQAHQSTMSTGNVWVLVNILMQGGDLAQDEGDYEEARRLFEQGLEQARKIRSAFAPIRGHRGLAEVALALGAPRLAQHHVRESIKSLGNSGLENGVIESILYELILLAWAAIQLGELKDARGKLQEALKLMPNAFWFMPSYFLVVTADYLRQTGAHALAVELLSVSLHVPHHLAVPPRLVRYRQALVAALQVELPLEIYTSTYERGKTMTLNEALVELQVEFMKLST